MALRKRVKCSIVGLFIGIFRVLPVFATIGMLLQQILYFHSGEISSERWRRTVQTSADYVYLRDDNGKEWKVERQFLMASLRQSEEYAKLETTCVNSTAEKSNVQFNLTTTTRYFMPGVGTKTAFFVHSFF